MHPSHESRSPVVWWISLVGLALVALTALRCIPQIETLLLDADGDDQMRLVQVRDWLAGQSWWDVRQYRVLPPEGISLHWSRYIDAALAGILWLAGLVLPQTQAEFAAVILWPSLLACLLVLVVAQGTARLLGAASAFGAIAVALSWSKLGGEFVPPRIDHHGLQILCATAIFYLSLVPGRPGALGAMAGALTALSLAIGLEMLPYLATVWGLVALRQAFDQPGTGGWLVGFGAAFTLSAPLLLAGQTPVANWTTPYCDVLAPPVMALGAVGVVATLVPVVAARWLRGPVARIAAMCLVTALGLWLAFPLLGGCLAGPYSAVPDEVRLIIERNVIEARPASLIIRTDPVLLGRVLLPPLVLMVLGWLVAARLWRNLTNLQRTAVMQASVIALIGLGFALIQIRAANLMAPAIPFFGGLLVHAFARIPRASMARIPAVVALVLAMPPMIENGLQALKPALSAAASGSGAPTAGVASSAGIAVAATNCRTPTAMAELASLPPSVLFSTLNLGPSILAYTGQSVTSAGYHRSPEAFWNGVGAFTSEANLAAALRKSGAGYVVLCNGGTLELTSPMIVQLQRKELPAWLTDVSGDRVEVQVLQVDAGKLPAEAAP